MMLWKAKKKPIFLLLAVDIGSGSLLFLINKEDDGTTTFFHIQRVSSRTWIRVLKKCAIKLISKRKGNRRVRRSSETDSSATAGGAASA